MSGDTELEHWRQQWQANAVIPRDLRNMVDSGTRHLRQGLVAEIVVTVVMGGGSAGWALMSQRLDAIILALGIWIIIGIAWATSIALRRDLWRPIAETQVAFLDLTILRTKRQVQGVLAQAVLYVVILTFDLAWIYYRNSQTQVVDPWAFVTSRRLVVVWAVTGILAAVAVWYWRRKRVLLENLMQLRHQLDEPR